jgi:hypothetical protein
MSAPPIAVADVVAVYRARGRAKQRGRRGRLVADRRG